MKQDNKTAAIYLRVSALDSRDVEGEENRSHASTERDCLKKAEREGLTVTQVFREKVGTSASHLKPNSKRPQLAKALEGLGQEYSTIIFWALDRSTRWGMLECGEILARVEETNSRVIFEKDGIDYDTRNPDPTARLIIAIRAEIARDEIVKLSSRVCRGKEEQRRRGEFVGGALPWGLIRDKNAEYGVTLDEEIAEHIREAANLVIAGTSLKGACDSLNEKGLRTTTGSFWRPTTLRRTFTNHYTLGHRGYNNQTEVFRDEEGNPVQVHPPIFTQSLHTRLMNVLKERAKHNGAGDQKMKHPPMKKLSGLIRCGTCQSPMSRDKRTSTTGKQNPRTYHYNFYRCPVCTPRHRVGAEALEDLVVRATLNFLGTLEPDSPVLDEVGFRWMSRFTPDQINRHAELKDEIISSTNRLEDLQKEFYEGGTMDKEMYDRLNRNLTKKVKEMKEELALTPQGEADLTALLDLAQSSDDPEDIIGEGSSWNALSEEEQREIMKILVNQVTVKYGKPSDVTIDRIEIEFVSDDNLHELLLRGDRVWNKKADRTTRKVEELVAAG